MSPSLSIIIPTHERADILVQCLERIEKQTIASKLEVIIVSDGPDPETQKMIDIQHSTFNIHYFDIPKSQQGAARNRGVQEATAPFVLFIGDDAFLTPDACEKHLAAHKAQGSKPIAVLGFTTWDQNLDITPAMRWLEETGWQFGYNLIKNYQHRMVPKEMQHRFTYTINISVPTAVAKAHPFREDVTLYGWEDILWGQELSDADIGLYYEPDAAAFHHHHISLDDSLQRIETLGQSLMHITKVAPELDRKPKGWKLLAYKLIAMTPTMRGKHYKAFLKGMEKNN